MDVINILEKLAEYNLIKLNRPLGRYYSIYCPFHSDGNERRPSCGVLLNDEYRNGQYYPAGWTHCFTCHYAKDLPDMITDLLKLHSIDSDGVSWLKEQFGDEYDFESAIEYLLPKNVVDQVRNKFALDYIRSQVRSPVKHIDESELSKYRVTVPYMYERGLTDELIEKFDVGVDLEFIPPGRKRVVPSITFPVRDMKGRTLFICRRSIKGKAFYLPPDIQKCVYGLYELPKNVDRVLIAESCFNALTSWKYGVPAVALLGTGTAYQLEQLKHLGVSEYILGFDPDDAGKVATRKIKKALKSISIVRCLNDIPSGKDINDLSESEFLDVFERRL